MSTTESRCQKIGKVYDRYEKLYRAHTDKYRQLLYAAMPELGTEYCFHLCHNWGNDEARKILDKYERTSSALVSRNSAEINRVHV